MKIWRHEISFELEVQRLYLYFVVKAPYWAYFLSSLYLDPSLHELVRRILPLCSNYSTVVRFIEEKSAFEYGLVNHALSAAMRSLIKVGGIPLSPYFVTAPQINMVHCS